MLQKAPFFWPCLFLNLGFADFERGHPESSKPVDSSRDFFGLFPQVLKPPLQPRKLVMKRIPTGSML